jgi:glycosyltransferase involved in cell wall biosynthesis
MRISVIVPTFNRNDLLVQTVDALINQNLDKSQYEIVVVDDCSTIDARSVLDKYLISNPHIIYVRHEVNKGLAASRNTGIINATGDIVLFLDSDIVPEQSFVKTHLNLHMSFKDEYVAVVSNLRYDEECIRNSNFAKFMNNRYLGNRSIEEKAFLNLNNLPPQYFGGGISSVRKDRMITLGMFDMSFVKYGGEDEDMGYRLSQSGVRIMYCDNAKAVHHDTVSLTRFKAKAIEWKRNAFPIISAKQQGYFERTNLRFLMPIKFENDGVWVTVKKVLLKCMLSKPVVFLLEKWALYTDTISFFYFPSIYRALMAGWFLTTNSVSNSTSTGPGVWK